MDGGAISGRPGEAREEAGEMHLGGGRWAAGIPRGRGGIGGGTRTQKLCQMQAPFLDSPGQSQVVWISTTVRSYADPYRPIGTVGALPGVSGKFFLFWDDAQTI